ncbi:pyruvate kinase [Bacillota bacterium]
MKKTKIVCTIGPVSEKEEILVKMILAGMNVARLNFSHGDYTEHGDRIAAIRKAAETAGLPVAIMLDTKGPEIRTGSFEKEVFLAEGQAYMLTTRDIPGDDSGCSISYKGLPGDVKAGDIILIDDGLVALKVYEVTGGEDIHCIVQNSGSVKSHKGINVPGIRTSMLPLTEKDRADIEFGIEKDIDFIAASFVRKASDVMAIREVLRENQAGHIQIIAKIENGEGIDNLDEIIEAADCIMVARGDLGVEVPAEELPLLQKKIIRKCNRVGKPVITATQLLDSMIRNPRPTRAEVTDVANAILDGTDAIMLSGETAIGKYPIESVATMSRVAKRTEEAMDYFKLLSDHNGEQEPSVTDAISHATCTIAMGLGAEAILTGTSSGYTARMVSKFRPKQPIIATTTDARVQRRLCLSWGVYCILLPSVVSTDDLINKTVSEALEHGKVKEGDLVVITAGIPVGVGGTTNLIKAHVVGQQLSRGGAGLK